MVVLEKQSTKDILEERFSWILQVMKKVTYGKVAFSTKFLYLLFDPFIPSFFVNAFKPEVL